ncbi:MAG: DUF1801 domain-containing protein [Proteobacteria bacterium]|uniref:iron chaperone n=1 Tax=Rudaea sp. TaxID=2136325 RepID=UPI0032206417|nr:DUF1801 domain-containing protein [Pseudomonadota bacterium]
MSQATKKTAGKSGKGSAAASKAAGGFSVEERAAMKARVQEMKAEARASRNREEGESAVLSAIARMKEPDRAMATRLHALVTAAAPALMPKTWYGMPAYTKDEKVVCFFKDAQKFGDRYATFGFNDKALLDDGAMWPVAFALRELTAAVEAKIAALVKKAAG